jgi:hypothetical protein
MADLMWPITSFGILIITVLIGVFLVWRLAKERKSGFPARDERTQKITGKAATFAFYIGQYFTIALLAANIIGREFFGSFALEAGYALIASMLVYSVSFIIFRLYFGRKADS